ncbi:MAG: periplasmic heavy metal sensor [Verrucomicrobia bacterium]|nr:periplasmic heavy metal sensor [Verrucomicrobiota bacterium]
MLSARAVRSSAPAVVDAHQWLHDQLHLSKEQDEKMAPAEKRFLETRAKLIAEIRSANRELAVAIQKEGRWSPAVEAAIERGLRAQGELQRATVRHCLEISDYLTPEQTKRFLHLTSDALSRDAAD